MVGSPRVVAGIKFRTTRRAVNGYYPLSHLSNPTFPYIVKALKLYCYHSRHIMCQRTNHGDKQNCLWEPFWDVEGTSLFGQERTAEVFCYLRNWLVSQNLSFPEWSTLLKSHQPTTHLSIKCAIHVLHVNKFNPNCLHRRPADEVGECTSCPDGPESGHLG